MNELMNELFPPGAVDDLANRVITRTRGLLSLVSQDDSESLRSDVEALNAEVNGLYDQIRVLNETIASLKEELAASRPSSPYDAVLGGKK